MRLYLTIYFAIFNLNSTEMTDGDITRLNRMYQCPYFIDEDTDVVLRKSANCITAEAMGSEIHSEIPIEGFGTDDPAVEETATDSVINVGNENGSAKTERRAPAITSVIETDPAKTERSLTSFASNEKTVTATDASGLLGVKVKVKVKSSERNSDIAAAETVEQAPIFETPSAEPGVEGAPEETDVEAVEPSNDDFVDSESYKFLMEEEFEKEKNRHAQSEKLTAAEMQEDFLTDILLSPNLLDRITESLSFFLKPLCQLYYQLKSKSVAIKDSR